VTRILVQEGSQGAGQDTVMSYDGHGRLATRKSPIETSPTIYSYYKDDTVEKRTDPRGASISYSYNARHLMTGINYTRPESAPQVEVGLEAIPKPQPVGYEYDQAGNRVVMTDGQGRTEYQYDTWSRLRSETRFINELVRSYSLSYEYNLAGGLTKLTDGFGAVINYSFNHAGQVTGVNGSGYPNVTQFASEMKYRAWGGLKQMKYGSNINLNIGYNRRMNMSSFIGGFGSEFEYWADGRIKFASNMVNPGFDRSYSYDQVGRLTEAKTGSEARGGSAADGPYKQSYQYDVWDNLLRRTNRYWSQSEDLYTAGYVNDRNVEWQYDEAGNVKVDQLEQRRTTYR
jgi:YD repeat-containing protein